ncbi:caspase-8-like [Antedon mediterranea]|uniref:caspase-8-like n=1 Tax=Antedon mediterranea TaxID=105859 RepID=UPI003AF4183C
MQEDRIKYKMTNNPRGICLIINNIMFQDDGLKERTGSEVDEAYLDRIFNQLGFHVDVRHNLSAQEMKDVMTEMQSKDHSYFDCFVCCILSYGQCDLIYGSDGETCDLLDLASNFNINKCKSLHSKPKVFFVQACRLQNIEEDAKEDIPEDADFLFGTSAVPLSVSYRCKKHGSYFIRNLALALEERHETDHILDILTLVNAEVSQQSNSGVPAPRYTLRKALYFP